MMLQVWAATDCTLYSRGVAGAITLRPLPPPPDHLHLHELITRQHTRVSLQRFLLYFIPSLSNCRCPFSPPLDSTCTRFIFSVTLSIRLCICMETILMKVFCDSYFEIWFLKESCEIRIDLKIQRVRHILEQFQHSSTWKPILLLEFYRTLSPNRTIVPELVGQP